MIKTLIIGVVLTISGAATAQERPGAPAVLTTKPLRGGAYWIDGGRSNTGFIVGKTGVTVIDAQMSEDLVKQELAAIARLTDKPIKTVIVSHGDPDHIGGLPFYPPGIAIIEQENTWTKAVASASDPAAPPMYGAMYKRLVKDFPPTRTVGMTERVVIDGVPMELIHTGPAHTIGDLAIYLPQQRVVYAADVVLTNLGPYPVIHLGGSSLGWIEMMKAVLARDATVIVPGHGPIETRTQLIARLAHVEKRRAEIKALVMQGKTLAEIERVFPDPAANPRFLTFTQTVYNELTRGNPAPTPPWNDLVQH